MSRKKEENGSVVKIDSSLLKRIEEIINEEENRLKFVNKKQFVDLAVNDFLKKVKEDKNGG